MGRFDAYDNTDDKNTYFDNPGHTYVVEFLSAEETKTHKYDRAIVYRWRVVATDDPNTGAGDEKDTMDGCVEYYGKAYWAERMRTIVKAVAIASGAPEKIPANGDELERLFAENWEPFAGAQVQITTTDTGKTTKEGQPIVRTNVSQITSIGCALLGEEPSPSAKRFGA